MKTITPKNINSSERKWYLIDAKWQNLWRLSSKISTILRWKNKLDFISNYDNWDYVVVLNCDKVSVTWKKMTDKTYYRHSSYLWWLKEISLEDLIVKKPFKALELAVSWMLPKNKLRSSMISRLKMFVWEEHTYWAQKPEIINL